MPLTNYSMDKFVAPHMSVFTKADIPDMSDHASEQEHWVGNFVLNTLRRVNVPSPQRQFMFNFLRRAEAAFRDYGHAREHTLGYLANPGSVSLYVAAIGSWETFLSQAWHALGLLEGTAGVKNIWFVKGDGSVPERLNHMYNRSKHTESGLRSGDFPEETTLCVWLENAGLTSTEQTLTFIEMVDILETIAQWANRIQDPLSITSSSIAGEQPSREEAQSRQALLPGATEP